MALTVGELTAKIKLDKSGYDKDVDGVKKGLQNVETKADDAERAASGLKGKLGDVAKIAGGFVVAKGLESLAGALLGTVGAASDVEESQNKVNVVFGDSAGIINDFASNSTTALGLSKGAALEVTGTFGNMFTSMGLGQKEAANLSRDVALLGADLGSFNNIASGDALEKLRAGLVGEAEPLRALGINLNAAAVDAKAMELGLVDANGEISEAAKVQARYALIVEQSKNAQGDFARTSDGMANSQKIIGATFQDLSAQIGGVFLPLLTPLIVAFARRLPGAIETAGQYIGGFLDAIEPVTTFVGNNLTPILAGLAGAILTILVPAAIAWATTMYTTVIPALVATLVAMGPILLIAGAVGLAVAALYLAWQSNFLGIQDITKRVIDFITPYIEGAWEVIKEAFRIGKEVVTTVFGELVTFVTSLIDGDWKAAWDQAVGWFTGAKDLILEALPLIGEAILGFITDTLPDIVSKIGGWAWEFIAWVAPMIPDLLKELGSLLADVGGWMIGTALPAIITNLGKWAWEFVAWIGPQIPPLLVELGKLLISVGTWMLTTALPEIVSKLVEWGGAFLGFIAKDVLPELPGKLYEIVKAIFTFIGSKSAGATSLIISKLAAFASAFLGWIADVLPDLPGKLAGILTAIGQWVIDNADAAGDKMIDIGKAILEGIASGIRDNVDNIVGSAIDFVTDKLPGWVKDGLGISSPSKVMMPIGKEVVAGIAAGMKQNDVNLAKQAKETAFNLVSHIENAIPPSAIQDAISKWLPGNGMIPAVISQPAGMNPDGSYGWKSGPSGPAAPSGGMFGGTLSGSRQLIIRNEIGGRVIDEHIIDVVNGRSRRVY